MSFGDHSSKSEVSLDGSSDPVQVLLCIYEKSKEIIIQSYLSSTP